MKVVHINSSDSGGGAARACLDINTALNKNGIESSVLVQSKNTNSKSIHSLKNNFLGKTFSLSRQIVDYSLIKILTKEERGRFSFPYFGYDISKLNIIKNSDIIHLHWINGGFFSIKTFYQLKKLNKPIVWTLHDMWAFTGGCHYSLGCRNFELECKNCPSLKLSGENDHSLRIFNSKKDLYKDFNINLVTCSKWLSKEVNKSQLLHTKQVEVIPNTLKTEVYKPLDRLKTLKEFSLPENKKYILFGTMTLSDKRKGFDLLMSALKYLIEKNPNITKNTELIVLGALKNMGKLNFPMKTNYLGRMNKEEDVAKFYNLGDVFIAPSREDNLPNTVMESLSCGIPVVAFNIGGMNDMIEHQINGYLAEPYKIEELGNGVNSILNSNKISKLKENARMKILNNYSNEVVSKLYIKLYNDII